MSKKYCTRQVKGTENLTFRTTAIRERLKINFTVTKGREFSRAVVSGNVVEDIKEKDGQCE